jgi:hypothetical protein
VAQGCSVQIKTWKARFDVAKRFNKDADPPDGMWINPKSSFKSDRSLENRFGVPSSFRFHRIG